MAGFEIGRTALVGIGVVAVAAVTETGRSVVALLVVAPVLFFLPGLLLVRLLAPRRRLDFETAMGAIGFSIAMVLVTGLLLGSVGALTAIGWFLALTTICLFLFVRSRRAIGNDAASPLAPVTGFSFTPKTIAVAVVVVSLSAGGIAQARYGAVTHRQFTYTELWMLPVDGTAFQTVTVGVRNREQRPTEYRLEIRVDDRAVERWPRFTLADDEERVERIPVPVVAGVSKRIEARLFRDANDRVLYRQAWLSTQTSSRD